MTTPPTKHESTSPRARPTLREVARQAGVSTATVSLVINGKASEAGITESTQRIVREVVRRMQYTPNRMASAVVTGRSRIVGVVSALSRELFDTQFGVRVLGGFMRGARSRGYHFVFLEDIVPGREEDQRRVLSDVREMCLEGVVLLMDPRNEEATLQVGDWLSLPLPVVSVQFTFDPGGAPGFRVDHQHAVDTCMGHFLELGHTRIGFGARHIDPPRSRSAVALVQSFLAERGVEFDTDCLIEIPREEPGKRVVERIRDTKITALFTLYDREAIRVQCILREAGLEVPRDLSLMGYGDFPIAADILPGLTTYRPPMEEIGYEAMIYLIDCIEKNSEPALDGLRDVVGRLVVRGSTGKAPANDH
jgi:DNA-binding LacI/PurR family transcriptional regulator